MKELAFLQNHVEELRLQGKLGKQNFHENIKKLCEPLTDTSKDTSLDITKIITETSTINKKALEELNENVLELMNDKGMIVPYLASSLVNLINLTTKVNINYQKIQIQLGWMNF